MFVALSSTCSIRPTNTEYKVGLHQQLVHQQWPGWRFFCDGGSEFIQGPVDRNELCYPIENDVPDSSILNFRMKVISTKCWLIFKDSTPRTQKWLQTCFGHLGNRTKGRFRPKLTYWSHLHWQNLHPSAFARIVDWFQELNYEELKAKSSHRTFWDPNQRSF